MTDYLDPDQYVNDPTLEIAWAMKAAERAKIHMNLLLNCDTKVMRLIKQEMEDDVYETFRREFPGMDVQRVGTPELKDGEMKQRWNSFCENFKESVDDYNMGSLMRIDASQSYNEENTVVVPRIILLAVEIARNREGVNERNKGSYTHDFNSNETSINS